MPQRMRLAVYLFFPFFFFNPPRFFLMRLPLTNTHNRVNPLLPSGSQRVIKSAWKLAFVSRYRKLPTETQTRLDPHTRILAKGAAIDQLTIKPRYILLSLTNKQCFGPTFGPGSCVPSWPYGCDRGLKLPTWYVSKYLCSLDFNLCYSSSRKS